MYFQPFLRNIKNSILRHIDYSPNSRSNFHVTKTKDKSDLAWEINSNANHFASRNKTPIISFVNIIAIYYSYPINCVISANYTA